MHESLKVVIALTAVLTCFILAVPWTVVPAIEYATRANCWRYANMPMNASLAAIRLDLKDDGGEGFLTKANGAKICANAVMQALLVEMREATRNSSTPDNDLLDNSFSAIRSIEEFTRRLVSIGYLLESSEFSLSMRRAYASLYLQLEYLYSRAMANVLNKRLI